MLKLMEAKIQAIPGERRKNAMNFVLEISEAIKFGKDNIVQIVLNRNNDDADNLQLLSDARNIALYTFVATDRSIDALTSGLFNKDSAETAEIKHDVRMLSGEAFKILKEYLQNNRQ